VNGFILGPGWRIFRPTVLEFDPRLMDRGLAGFDNPNVLVLSAVAPVSKVAAVVVSAVLGRFLVDTDDLIRKTGTQNRGKGFPR
jgi:hypothetical protein